LAEKKRWNLRETAAWHHVRIFELRVRRTFWIPRLRPSIFLYRRSKQSKINHWFIDRQRPYDLKTFTFFQKSFSPIFIQKSLTGIDRTEHAQHSLRSI
jgi:hypothetical protein